ncbi:hypothetical protein [Halapricum hydrolyticum]|uniref:Uncharacterized protein n=1 Tax=Halapricum hydrolyticum TaxID=2979991 RepID=A0AAE3I9I3_9EURY|nr:hypothetical protein [Halapricum hydrolyticum]MCU4716881.1 hypothetical protein [Halapricum hydrolyticum]MCU4725514.1 hypothetical protein [Halapricum hydrolyticum]
MSSFYRDAAIVLAVSFPSWYLAIYSIGANAEMLQTLDPQVVSVLAAVQILFVLILVGISDDE